MASRVETSPRAGVDRQPEAVGAAVAQRARHPQQGLLLHGRPRLGAHDAGDAAHLQPGTSRTTAGAWR
jgi:hypothetical protein